mmetsp:Transcript_33644/g.42362  ORF Transcript_33644/g.42362 Transcript_33644/m.42362 type:complete len:686 (-) Transcript_33644:267-2324(-)
MQGPCAENQAYIAGSQAIDVCKMVLSCQGYTNLKKNHLDKQAKAKALLVFESCMEGRDDIKVQRVLAQKLEPRLLDSAMVGLAKSLDELEAEEKSVKSDGNSEFEDIDKLNEFIRQNVDEASISLFAVRQRLVKFPEFGEEERSSRMKAVKEKLESRLASVEIQWQDRIERVLFPLPPEAQSLTAATKEAFEETVDLDTQDMRLKQFMAARKGMLDEMRVLYNLRNAKVYTRIKDNYRHLIQFNFFTAVVLNLLVLLSLEGGTIYNTRTTAATTLLVTLAIISLCGYTLIIVFLLRSEYHLTWHKLKRERVTAGKGVNFRPLLHWAAFLLCYIAVCFVHAVGFANVTNSYLEGYAIFGGIVFGIFLLKSYRSCLEIPKRWLEMHYVCIYDVMVDEKIAVQLIMCGCTALGFYRAFFFSFLLFDVISLSEDLKNTVRAVLQPIKSLAATGLLFLIVIVTFATIGFTLFSGDAFCEDDCDDDEPAAPETPIDAFWVVLNFGIREQDIGQAMIPLNHDDADYIPRIVFMLCFFIILGVLLFDMVTGIILDQFSRLREAGNKRDIKRKDEHFISGVRRETYDELGLNFERLTKEHQSLWNYMYFMFYLEKKDSSGYTGAEYYVKECIDKDDNSWFPTRTSLELQARNVVVNETSMEEQVSSLHSKIEDLQGQFSDISKKMNQLLSKQET